MALFFLDVHVLTRLHRTLEGNLAWPEKIFVLTWWRWSQGAVRWCSQYSQMQIYLSALTFMMTWEITFWLSESVFWPDGNFLPWPRALVDAVPSLGWLLAWCCSTVFLPPPFHAAPGKETLFLILHVWLSLLHLLFVFMYAMLNSASLFFFCFGVIWLCLTVQFSCYIVLACHSNGILSQSVTPPNILHFYVTLLNTSFLRWRAADMTQGSLFKA